MIGMPALERKCCVNETCLKMIGMPSLDEESFDCMVEISRLIIYKPVLLLLLSVLQVRLLDRLLLALGQDVRHARGGGPKIACFH